MSSELQFPCGLDAAGFLRKHWQRTPLLLRQALPEYRTPLSAEELAGLACEPGVESRLVLEYNGDYPWEVRYGPFDEADFSALPESHWTLLVQDVDKQIPQVADLLDAFRFLPNWRIDDLMVSYAADGGSVGPHLDEYDVFLLQAAGQRRWQLDPVPDTYPAVVPDLDLRILERFEPKEEHILEPGDILYLPPGVPHWGIAEGACLTFSVGFRAPSWRELGSAWGEFAAERQLSTGRFEDGPLAPQSHSGEILPAVFEQVRETLLRALGDESGRLFREWFGRFVTEPKENLRVFPPDEPLTSPDLRSRIEQGEKLQRHGFSRMAFSRTQGGEALLYASGEAYAIASRRGGFLALLTRERLLSHDKLIDWLGNPECLDLLRRLYNDGHYELRP